MKREGISRETARLEEEKTKAEERIQRLTSYLKSEVESGGGREPRDSADAAFALYEQEDTLALISNLRDKVLSIENALRMVRKGSYGICEMCGQGIDPARLEILPYTTLCLHCQADKEVSTRRT